MREDWKPLVGLVINGEDYFVSNLGRVWSNKTKRILKQAKGSGGYLFVTFSQRSVTKQYDVHRLVAKAFIYNGDKEKIEVNHVDGDKENNRTNNLEWVTRSENIKHAYKTGLRKPLPASNPKKASELSCKPVAKIDTTNDEIISVYQSASEAIRRDSSTPRSTICYQCQNNSVSTKNSYYFRYATSEQIYAARQAGTYYESEYFAKEASE